MLEVPAEIVSTGTVSRHQQGWGQAAEVQMAWWIMSNEARTQQQGDGVGGASATYKTGWRMPSSHLVGSGLQLAAQLSFRFMQLHTCMASTTAGTPQREHQPC